MQAQCFQGRITRSSASLLLVLPHRGNLIWINGQYLDLSAVSVECNFTDALIDADGLDAGVSPGAQICYYAYVSNNVATFAPQTLRLSTFQPTELGGVLYLGTSGNAANWRFAGLVGTWASTFKDEDQFRLVGNYYNRVPRRLFVNPGYVNDNANTTISVNTASYQPVNGGTSDFVAFVGWGGVVPDVVNLHAIYSSGVIGANSLRVGIAGALDVGAPGQVLAASAFTAAAQNTEVTVVVPYVCDTGINVATMMAYSQSVASTLIVDRTRNGNVADPPSTFLAGTVLA